MVDELSRKVDLFRSRIEVLDRNGWCHELGAPADTAGNQTVPGGLAELYGIVNGLTTRLHNIDTLDAVTGRLSVVREPSDLFDPTPGLVQFGNIYYSFALSMSVEHGTVSLLDADEFVEAVVHQETLAPTVLAATPVEFVDSYLFGSRYLELIELAGGYLNPEDEECDEWRFMLEEVKLL